MTLNSHLWLTIVALAAYYGCIADGARDEPLIEGVNLDEPLKEGVNLDEPLKGYGNPGFEGEEAFEGEEDKISTALKSLKSFANPDKILTALKSFANPDKALKYKALKSFANPGYINQGSEEGGYMNQGFDEEDYIRSETERVQKGILAGMKKQCGNLQDKGVIEEPVNMFFTPEVVNIMGNYIQAYFNEAAQKLKGCTFSTVMMERTDADVLGNREEYFNGVTLSYKITNDALNDAVNDAVNDDLMTFPDSPYEV